MQKITPFLWFDQEAEEAVTFYASIFERSNVGRTTRYGEGAPLPKGTVMTVSFQLGGQEFMALNGGPLFKFSPAISFFVNCETQAEVDHFWEKLSTGGEKQRCGWLKDRFGVSWQIIPAALGEFLQNKDPEKAKRAAAAMFKMTKIEIEGLKRTIEQE